MQLYIIHLFPQIALHVSGGSSAHHQELKTVHTASGFFQPYTATCHYRGRIQLRRIRLKLAEHFAEINELCKVASSWLCL
jgi:hypothetical protein